MKKLVLAAASTLLLSGTAYAGNHTTNFVEYGSGPLEWGLSNGYTQSYLDGLFDETQAGGWYSYSNIPGFGSGIVYHDTLGSRYRQNTSSPDDTEQASQTAGGTFTLQGQVNADCSFYNGSSSTHTLDLGTIGIRTGDNENVTVAFNQAGTATAHVDTATAGCNTHNVVTIAEQNAGAGLVNSNPGPYDSAQFTANIPYALNASWTGVDEATTTGFAKSLTVAAGSSGTGTNEGGAWRSAFNMDITVPPQSLGLVAGKYSDQITVTLAVD
jgi:hypothetical protein